MKKGRYIQRAVLEWEDEERKIYSYVKPNKMKESFRRGLTPALWKKTIKEVSKIDDKRIWIDEKTSMPPVVEFLAVPCNLYFTVPFLSPFYTYE
jgi:hypothetical protein